MTSDNGGKCFFLFQGVANSGKSLLVNLIESFYPEHMTTVLPIESLSKPFSASRLHERLLCTVPDMPNKPIDAISASLIKQITGGDRISADIKNKDRIDFKSSVRFILTTNHQFITASEEPALLGRLVLLPFPFTVPPEERDTNLIYRLHEERSAILNFALQAYRSLVSHNYIFSGTYPVNVVVDTPNSRVSSKGNTVDCIGQFIETYIRPDPNGMLFIDDLYQRFISEYTTQYLDKAGFSKKFRQAIMKIARVEDKRARKPKEKNPQHALLGISWKTST